MRAVFGSVALVAALFASASTAWAQSDEQRANARALADQGAQAFSQEHWQEAIDLFERAESLVDAPTHLLFSARAHAKLHHYVKSRELYLRIIRQQLGSDAPRAFRNAQTSAGQELKDVEPHIGQLTISLRGADPKLAKITMDGTVVQSVLIGVARPIDPGEHQIQAEAPGFAAQTQAVTVGDGAKASAVLELIPVATTVAVAGLPTTAATPGGPPSEPQPSSGPSLAGDTTHVDVSDASGANKKKIVALVALGVGAVGLGVGTLFVATSASKRSQADKKALECGAGCSNDNPLAGQITTLDNSARTAQTIGIVGFVAGGLAVGAGVVLFALSSHDKKSAATLVVEPRLGLGSVGVMGRF